MSISIYGMKEAQQAKESGQRHDRCREAIDLAADELEGHPKLIRDFKRGYYRYNSDWVAGYVAANALVPEDMAVQVYYEVRRRFEKRWIHPMSAEDRRYYYKYSKPPRPINEKEAE